MYVYKYTVMIEVKRIRNGDKKEDVEVKANARIKSKLMMIEENEWQETIKKRVKKNEMKTRCSNSRDVDWLLETMHELTIEFKGETCLHEQGEYIWKVLQENS